jgi:CrcB protein
MLNLFLVMAGGALGSGARFAAGRLTLSMFGPNYPFGTLAVNLIGGLLMGILAGSLSRIGSNGEQWRYLLGVGLLGGFTTFSAFSLDTMVMIERGDWGMALTYILVSVCGSILALFAGLSLTRVLA